jgi:hypothetical protein
MATWQYDIQLVPRSAVSAPEAIGAEGWNQEHSAASVRVVADLAKLLPEMRSWHESMRTWGTEDGDRIDIWFENERVSDVLVRIDVRRVSMDFLHQILDVVERNDLVIQTEGGAVVPDVGGLLEGIKASDAFRFVQNPGAFMEELHARRRNA